MIEHILFFIYLYIVSVVFHEIGHWYILFYDYKIKNARIVFDRKIKTEFEATLSKEQKIYVLNAGIYSGFIPIFISMICIEPFFIASVFVAIPYVVGCKKDLAELGRLNK